MGRILFGEDIAAEIAAATDGELPLATLRSVQPGTRSATNPAAGNQAPDPTEHTCSVVPSEMSSLRKETIVPEATGVILIIGDSITPRVRPKNNDTITLEGETTTIVNVSSDPALATFTCQVK